MTYATTFSGIDAWAIGLYRAGWQLKWQCESNPWCRKLLAQKFGAPICPDIRSLTQWLTDEFGSIERASVDALIGSAPCQPFSAPGNGGGDSDERHLYPAFLYAVGQLKPRWVLMEQVPGIRNPTKDKRDGTRRLAAIGQYLGGLAALGYDCLAHSIPASAIGADHQRDRVWIIAHSNSIRKSGPLPGGGSGEAGQGGADSQAHLFSTGWRNRPLLGGQAESILCRSVDGPADWSHRIEAIGNCVHPRIPELIARAINQIEMTK